MAQLQRGYIESGGPLENLRNCYSLLSMSIIATGGELVRIPSFYVGEVFQIQDMKQYLLCNIESDPKSWHSYLGTHRPGNKYNS
jgi:hypothetical protein